MARYTPRRYRGEADIQPLTDLTNAEIAAGDPGDPLTVDEMRQFMSSPSVDFERNVQLWEDDAANVVAFAGIQFHVTADEAEAMMQFDVHPAIRGNGVEDEIMDWYEGRLRASADEVGIDKPRRLRLRFRDADTYRTAVVTRHGLTRERYYLTVERDLTAPIPAPGLPPGFAVRGLQPDEADRYIDLYNESFHDHFNHRPWTRETYAHYASFSSFDPSLNLIAIAPNGDFAAFCWAEYEPEKDPAAIEIHLLGTRPAYRRHGLGRAMMLAAMTTLGDRGAKHVRLRVDSENASGALQLYTDLGFREVFRIVYYTKLL